MRAGTVSAVAQTSRAQQPGVDQAAVGVCEERLQGAGHLGLEGGVRLGGGQLLGREAALVPVEGRQVRGALGDDGALLGGVSPDQLGVPS